MIRTRNGINGNEIKKKSIRKQRSRGASKNLADTIEELLLPGLSFFFFVTVTCFYILSSQPSSGGPLHHVGSSDEIQQMPLPGKEILKPKRMGPRFDEMPGIGDKSDAYRALREEFEVNLLPYNAIEERAHFVESLKKNKYEQMHSDIGYDIYNCPLNPPANYPYAFNIVSDILTNWPADDTKPRPNIYMTFCVFDFETESEKAKNYQEAEVPYILRNDPAVHRTVERWSYPDYLKRMLGDEPHRTEYSANNHFMYWVAPRQSPNAKIHKTKDGGIRAGKKIIPKGWTEPTKMIKMEYADWISKANQTDESKLGPDNPHWYYRLIGCGKGMSKSCDPNNSENLFDELPFFQPKHNLYMVHPSQQKGIHCRFGMKGVIAENHFDGSRNQVVILGGERRYILAHPYECENLALYPKQHPSGRHSAVDWSEPDLEHFPQFKKAMGNEVVMQAGDVMYLPTNWFHYIISLDLNFQCNTRSGRTEDYDMKSCGF